MSAHWTREVCPGSYTEPIEVLEKPTSWHCGGGHMAGSGGKGTCGHCKGVWRTHYLNGKLNRHSLPKSETTRVKMVKTYEVRVKGGYSTWTARTKTATIEKVKEILDAPVPVKVEITTKMVPVKIRR